MGGSPKVRGEIIIKEKQCKDCKEWKPITDFYSAGIRKDGLGIRYQPYCKPCDGARKGGWTALHRFRDREMSKEKRIRRKRGVSWYGNREYFCKRRFGVGFNKLSDKQKEAVFLIRLHSFSPYLLPDEMREVCVLVENKVYDTVSKIIFKSFMERINNEDRQKRSPETKYCHIT